MKILMRHVINRKQIKNLALARQLTFKYLNYCKFYIGPTIKNWLFPYISFERDSYLIFNLFLLIKGLREMLYLVYNHSYMKNLIVIHSTNSPENLFTYIAYGFAGDWVNGFLTNFKRLMGKQQLKKTLIKTTKKLRKKPPILRATKIAYLPSLAIDLGKTTHWFIVEALSLGLNCIFTVDNNIDSTNYNTKALAFNTSTCAVESISLLIRETICNAKLDDFFFFRKRLYTNHFKKEGLIKNTPYKQFKNKKNDI